MFLIAKPQVFHFEKTNSRKLTSSLPTLNHAHIEELKKANPFNTSCIRIADDVEAMMTAKVTTLF